MTRSKLLILLAGLLPGIAFSAATGFARTGPAFNVNLTAPRHDRAGSGDSGAFASALWSNQEVLAVNTADSTVLPAMVSGDAAASTPKASSPTQAAVKPQSGVFGFSGTKGGRGVIGECVWIYDAANLNLVATGSCLEKSPGHFRVNLSPGHYVLRGPGGRRTVLVKDHAWTHVDSRVQYPGM